MEYTTIVGIDLARIKFHFAVTDKSGKVVKKFAMSRDDFFDKVENLYQAGQTICVRSMCWLPLHRTAITKKRL